MLLLFFTCLYVNKDTYYNDMFKTISVIRAPKIYTSMMITKLQTYSDAVQHFKGLMPDQTAGPIYPKFPPPNNRMRKLRP